MLAFALLLACARCREAPTPPAAAPPPAARVAEAPTALAPSREAFGLGLGSADDAAVRAWLSTNGLAHCTAEPSVRRTTFRYTCEGELPATVLGARKVQGRLTQVLVVRPDGGPVSHVSTLRKYSIPEAAADDYASAVAVVSAALGAPTRGATVDLAKLAGPVVHYATEWRFADLQVRLVLMRMSGDYWSISETWDVPGAELAEQARPSTGKKPHGDGEKPWWHP